MKRYFVEIHLPSPATIDLLSSETNRVVSIIQNGSEFDVEKTLFDFSIGIVDPHRASNSIHRLLSRKPRVDGFIANVLRPGKKFREVDEAEYLAYVEALHAKAKYMERKRGRRLVATEEREPIRSSLP